MNNELLNKNIKLEKAKESLIKVVKEKHIKIQELEKSNKEMINCFYLRKRMMKEIQETEPSLGLPPKFICNELRIKEIYEAIDRYQKIGKEIPNEWILEIIQLNDTKKDSKILSFVFKFLYRRFPGFKQGLIDKYRN